MDTKKQGVTSYFGLSWLLIASLFLVGLIAFMAKPPTENSGSMGEPSVSRQVDEPDEEAQENLAPVRAWFEAHDRAGEHITASTVYSDYMVITDDTESLVLKVPTAFGDIDMGKWRVDDETLGLFLMAAGDLERFEAGEPEAGVWMGVYAPSDDDKHEHEEGHEHEHEQTQNGYRSLTAEERARFEGWLAEQQDALLEGCQAEGRHGYQDSFYKGNYDFYVECDQNKHHQLVLTTSAPHSPYIIVLRINLLSEADLEAVAHILDSFQVVGTLGHDEHHH